MGFIALWWGMLIAMPIFIKVIPTMAINNPNQLTPVLFPTLASQLVLDSLRHGGQSFDQSYKRNSFVVDCT